jgi:hypothetical protein
MRRPAARWRREPSALTRHRDRSAPALLAAESPAEKRLTRGQMLRRSCNASQANACDDSQPSFGGEKSLPHARQDRQASSVSRPLEGRQRRKSPVRRCFKSRPPFGGVRRFASGCRFVKGRLTGLLSRSPPTDTRPQARAYWASLLFGRIARKRKRFFQNERIFSRRHKTVTIGPCRTASRTDINRELMGRETLFPSPAPRGRLAES